MAADGGAAAWLGQDSHVGQDDPDNIDSGLHHPPAIVQVLEQWLQSPLGAASCDETSGYVSICDAVSMCGDLRDLTKGALAPVAEAVRTQPPNGPISLDAERRSVRLRTLSERLRGTAEGLFARLQAPSAGLLDILNAPEVEALLRALPEVSEQLQALTDALASSSILEVQGPRVVRREDWPHTAPSQDWSQISEPWPGAWAGQPPPEGHDMVWAEAAMEAPCQFWSAGSMEHWMYWSMSQDQQPLRRKQFKDRRQWLSALLAEILENPRPEVTRLMEADGSIPVGKLMDVCPAVADGTFRKPSNLLRAITTGPNGVPSRVAADLDRQTVRLKTLAEQLCDACEQCLLEKAQTSNPEPTPLGEILMSGPVQEAFSRAPASSTEGESTQAVVLRQALEAWDLAEVTEEAPGLHLVSLCPVQQILKQVVEEQLSLDTRVRSLLVRDGEVPLRLLEMQPGVARCLARLKISGSQARQESLRAAVEASKLFVLDGPRMSVRHANQDLALSRPLPAPVPDPVFSSTSAGGGSRNTQKPQRKLPKEKDAQQLRKLLGFYFDWFNLQHNPVLMSIVRAQRAGEKSNKERRLGYLRSCGQRPVFLLKDLFSLPRISKIFEKYDPDFAPLLLGLSTLAAEELPVKVSSYRAPGTPRGTWAAEDPRLELTYMPDLRFIEALDSMCPEVQQLVRPVEEASEVAPNLPSGVFCVVSYSVSSDLSHGQSPKAEELKDQVVEGSMDLALLSWDCRLLKIKRQLLMYDPDILCLQGVQSVGFAERCSEWELDWFNFEDEPASNHLVHLYREVSKANYGVAFAPTMRLPGSDVVCFGNAVLWKRSRWQVESQGGIQNAAACVRMSSRLGDLKVAACSAKAAGAYARDWGEEVTPAQLAGALVGVQQALVEALAEGFQPLLCGDMAWESRELLQGLKEQAVDAAPEWKSACAEVLGQEPWSSVSKYTAHKAVDMILHCDGLEVLAVMGGLQSEVSMADFINRGYPSDHLMQLAVLADANRQMGVPTEGFPELEGAQSVQRESKKWPQVRAEAAHDGGE